MQEDEQQKRRQENKKSNKKKTNLRIGYGEINKGREDRKTIDPTKKKRTCRLDMVRSINFLMISVILFLLTSFLGSAQYLKNTII